MTKTLIAIGGIIYLLGGLFHVWMGVGIHGLGTLEPSHRGLMEMLNVGVALTAFFFAYASLFHTDALIKTKLGRSVIWIMMITFLSRAVGEIVFFDFDVFWFGVSVMVACLYVVVLFLIWKSSPSGVQSEQT